MTDNLNHTLQQINWDFSDYNSLKYPLDINSIPWYPATFVPLIPKFLIPLLSEKGSTVFDPFGGKGTTAVESLKSGRVPIYNDLNPYAVEITQGIFMAIKGIINSPDYMADEKDIITSMPQCNLPTSEYIEEQGANREALDWYEDSTLRELLNIVRLMRSEKEQSIEKYLTRKLALSSILKPASSQAGHFTYVTDNCKPSVLVKKDAIELYLDRIDRILLSINDLVSQYREMYSVSDLTELLNKSKIHEGDARNLSWIDTGSVDLVLTSPPYLCAQDYIKTMRLTNLFFQNGNFNLLSKEEIGPRCKRGSTAKTVVDSFYCDMRQVFAEVERLLKPGGYFCLIFGQGKGKITSGYDTVKDIHNTVLESDMFEVVFQTERNISSRVIQVGGVDKETIFIFRKKKHNILGGVNI